MSNPEWDGDNCPFCGSTEIVVWGSTKGEDTGDDGEECSKWECKACGQTWMWGEEQ